MLRRIRFKPLLAPKGAIDFLRRNGALFHNSVGHNRRHRTVEEIENPVNGCPSGSHGVRRCHRAADPLPAAAVRDPVRGAAPPAPSTCPAPLPAVARSTPETGMSRLPRSTRMTFVFGILSQSIRNLAKTQGCRK